MAFPGVIMPLVVSGQQHRSAVDYALGLGAGVLALVFRRDRTDDSPNTPLYDVGCAVQILRTLKVADDDGILVQGLARILVRDLDRTGAHLLGAVDPIVDPINVDDLLDRKSKIVREEMILLLSDVLGARPDTTALLNSITDPGQLFDFVITNLALSTEDTQRFLETLSLAERGAIALEHIRRARKYNAV